MAKNKLQVYIPENEDNLFVNRPLPIDNILRLYTRVSTNTQTRNHSTHMQTESFPEALTRYGWTGDMIQLIDNDTGTSGALPLEEREGMRELLHLIEQGVVKAIAAEYEDRLFRDKKQIESNIFIDACRRHGVFIITRSMIYDFSHPQYGEGHIKLFRQKIEHAAEYFAVLHKRMEETKAELYMMGMQVAGLPSVGFLVDNRRLDPLTGQRNLHFKKYMPLAPITNFLNQLLERVKDANYSIRRVWREMEKDGTYFPTIAKSEIPDGFQYTSQIRRRSAITGLLMPSYAAFEDWLTHPRLVGHWTVKNAIVILNNHPPCVDVDLFMDVFKHISPVDFFGETNPIFVPQAAYNRSLRKATGVEFPRYGGMVFSESVQNKQHSYLSRSFVRDSKRYDYVLTNSTALKTVFTVSADLVDDWIDKELKTRLVETVSNEGLWQEALRATEMNKTKPIKVINTEIIKLKHQQEQLISGLTSQVEATSTEYHTVIAKNYHALKIRLEDLEMKRAKLSHELVLPKDLLNLHNYLQVIIDNWSMTSTADRLELLKALARYVDVDSVGKNHIIKQFRIHWHDDYLSFFQYFDDKRIPYWTDEEKHLLGQMIVNNVDQVQILAEFPVRSWRTIKQAYARFCNKGRFPKDYMGRIDFPNNDIQWTHTLEAAAYFASQLPLSFALSSKSKTQANLRPIEPLKLFILLQGSPVLDESFMKNSYDQLKALNNGMKFAG